MGKLACLVCLTLSVLLVHGQKDTVTRTRFVIGVSAPELLHTGINFDLAKFDQIGFSAGLGPTWGGVWPTLNVENRIYFGKTNRLSNRKQLFCRQGATWFTAAESQYSINFTLGGDLRSKRANSGWTIDGGFLVLFDHDIEKRTYVWPALRFQYYTYFKKNRNR